MSQGKVRAAVALRDVSDTEVAGMVRMARAASNDNEAAARLFGRLTTPERRTIAENWLWQRHDGQVPPDAWVRGRAARDDWRTWVLMAGRGFGKTRAGAEWASALARAEPRARIALVGASAEEAARVMVEGVSGLLAVARTGEAPLWLRSEGQLVFASGARAYVYSGANPDGLRGPEHHFAWCDELAKWAHPQAAWDNLRLGLRLGAAPRALVTTTPRPVAALRAILAHGGTALTRGRTADNAAHLGGGFVEDMVETYGGTRLGRQELDGELLEDVAGALWPRDVIEKARQSSTLPREELRRVVVGVDPPGSVDGDACGIVVCGDDRDERLYVLADASVAGLRPEGWARAVAKAAEAWGADRVIAEKNNGGDMVESVLRSVDANMPVTLVSATHGKVSRAAPVAARFEAGKAFLAGRFPQLEDEMAGLSWGGDYEGPGRSPDRVDAMVWAMTALMKPPREYRFAFIGS
ncbi:MAG: DNA-packaging protein [Alphaproteobacteria bacterium]|nr:DNA-packaging protein [Alphaproteobacteria bacterium]